MKEITISDLFKDTVESIKDLKRVEILLQESFTASAGELSECYRRMLASALNGKDYCELSIKICTKNNAEVLREQGFEVKETRDSLSSIITAYLIEFNKKENSNSRQYEVWVEGYNCTGQSSKAQYLGKYTASSFVDACREACMCKCFPFELRDGIPISWGCRMFDNEADARKTFG